MRLFKIADVILPANKCQKVAQSQVEIIAVFINWDPKTSYRHISLSATVQH